MGEHAGLHFRRRVVAWISSGFRKMGRQRNLRDRLIDEIRSAPFLDLARSHAENSKSKYLDVEYWVGRNFTRIRRLGLDTAAPLRILDVGSEAQDARRGLARSRPAWCSSPR